MTNNTNYSKIVRGVLFSPGYLIALLFTMIIFALGLKLTFYGILHIPFVFNWFVYFCAVLFWFYYNLSWLNIALYLPTTIYYTDKTYKALGMPLSWAQCFYISLTKVNKIRKDDLRIRRSNDIIGLLASAFVRPAVIANLRAGEARDLSKAVFIHTKRRVIGIFKIISSYALSVFIAVLILTPFIVFTAQYDFYFFNKVFNLPTIEAFWLYILILPLKLGWVFYILSVTASNVISPLVTVPCIGIFSEYVKENRTALDLNKKHHFPFEAAISCLMIVASLAFYISVLRNILL